MAYSQFNASPRPGQAKKVSHDNSDHRDMSGTNDDQYGTNTLINQPEISSTMELLKQLQCLVPLIEPMKQEVVQEPCILPDTSRHKLSRTSVRVPGLHEPEKGSQPIRDHHQVDSSKILPHLSEAQKRNSVQTSEGDKTLQKQNDDLLKQLREKEILLQKMEDSHLANKQKLEDLETEKKKAEDKLSRVQQKSAQEKKDLESQLDETKTRLSKMIGDKITDGNPDIANLSDENRPTKIAEKYCELYDNEWTDAFEAFEELGDEKTIISYLLSILKLTKKQCDIISERISEDITKAVYFSRQMPASVPQDVKKQIKDIRKVAAPFTTDYALQEVLTYLRYEIQDYTLSTAIKKKAVQKYIKKCTDICWFMVVQDPPLYFGPDVEVGVYFDKSKFKEYTKSGSRVAYLVWPDMYLKEGSRLCKGVAQGFGDPTERKKSAGVRPESAPAASQAHVSSPRDIKPTDRLMDHQIMHTCYQANAENTDRMLSGHDNNYEQITANSHQTGIYPNLSRSVHVPSVTTQYQEEKVDVNIRRADFYKNIPRGVPQGYWVNFVYDCDSYGIESRVTKAAAGQYYRACVEHFQNICFIAAIK